MKIPKAVVFDMDGVLSDSEWIYAEKILEVLREEGIYIEADEINDPVFICFLNSSIDILEPILPLLVRIVTSEGSAEK